MNSHKSKVTRKFKSMMDWIWGGMLLISLLMGIMTGSGAAVADAALAGAGEAVTLCVTLLGAYMLWMGLMNVAKEAGMIIPVVMEI